MVNVEDPDWDEEGRKDAAVGFCRMDIVVVR